MYVRLKLFMLCLAMDASVGVAICDSVWPYITVWSGLGPVRNGRCEDLITVSNDY